MGDLPPPYSENPPMNPFYSERHDLSGPDLDHSGLDDSRPLVVSPPSQPAHSRPLVPASTAPLPSSPSDCPALPDTRLPTSILAPPPTTSPSPLPWQQTGSSHTRLKTVPAARGQLLV